MTSLYEKGIAWKYMSSGLLNFLMFFYSKMLWRISFWPTSGTPPLWRLQASLLQTGGVVQPKYCEPAQKTVLMNTNILLKKVENKNESESELPAPRSWGPRQRSRWFSLYRTCDFEFNDQLKWWRRFPLYRICDQSDFEFYDRLIRLILIIVTALRLSSWFSFCKTCD